MATVVSTILTPSIPPILHFPFLASVVHDDFLTAGEVAPLTDEETFNWKIKWTRGRGRSEFNRESGSIECSV